MTVLLQDANYLDIYFESVADGYSITLRTFSFDSASNLYSPESVVYEQTSGNLPSWLSSADVVILDLDQLCKAFDFTINYFNVIRFYSSHSLQVSGMVSFYNDNTAFYSRAVDFFHEKGMLTIDDSTFVDAPVGSVDLTPIETSLASIDDHFRTLYNVIIDYGDNLLPARFSDLQGFISGNFSTLSSSVDGQISGLLDSSIGLSTGLHSHLDTLSTNFSSGLEGLHTQISSFDLTELNNLHEDILTFGSQLSTVSVPLQSLNGNGCEYADGTEVTVFGRDGVYTVVRSFYALVEDNSYTVVYDLTSSFGLKCTVPESLLTLYYTQSQS